MNLKLITSDFIKVCLANLFLFFSVYTLLPITLIDISPFIEAKGYEGWLLILTFIIAIIIGGPFHNYLIEHFNRKKICALSYLGIATSILVFVFSDQVIALFTALALLGLSFGLATAASITVAIDVTSPTNRDKGNVIYAYMGRIGMVLGVATSIIICTEFGTQMVLYVSLISILIAWLLIKITQHPFRAPIDTPTLSWDRFMLPRSWKIILFMTTIAFIIGTTLPFLIQLLEKYTNSDLTIQAKLILIPFGIFTLSIILSALEIFSLLRAQKSLFMGLRIIILISSLLFLFIYYKELSGIAVSLLVILILESAFLLYRIAKSKLIDVKLDKWDIESHIRLEVLAPVFSGLMYILLAHFIYLGTRMIPETAILNPYILLILLFGIARVSTPVFFLLILSARHCERGTANTSHQIAWELGMALGVLITAAFGLSASEVLYLNILVFMVSILLFVLITYRIFKIVKQQSLNH